jgi:hypothetical protein
MIAAPLYRVLPCDLRMPPTCTPLPLGCGYGRVARKGGRIIPPVARQAEGMPLVSHRAAPSDHGCKADASRRDLREHAGIASNAALGHVGIVGVELDQDCVAA